MLAFVALGGAAGAVARFGVSGWVHGFSGAAFPWGTLTVNVAGAFALGLTLRLLQASVAGPETRAFLAVGFLGAFTTFSTFSWEAIALIQDGEWARASLYLGGSVVAGLAAVLAGIWLAGAFLQARG